jgi:exosortase
MSEEPVSVATPNGSLLPSTWSARRLGFGAQGRDAVFAALLLLSAVWCWQPLITVIGRSFKSGDYEHYSHIVLMPFLSAYLVLLNREKIVKLARPGLVTGIPIMLVGAFLVAGFGASAFIADAEYRLSLSMLGLVVLWIGSFVIRYGIRASYSVTFPFALLLFMVPLPPAAQTAAIVFLQKASADVSAVIFGLIGMPFLRVSRFVFALPGLTIQVAEECSGIRSSLALLISGLVIGYLVLRRGWARGVFAALIIPVAIVKNAVRIVVLSWLAIHVDPAFIGAGLLHRTSGIPVFVTSLTILGGLAWLLRRAEGWTGNYSR